MVRGHWDSTRGVNMGIAAVTPSTKIKEVLERQELVEMREREYENVKAYRKASGKQAKAVEDSVMYVEQEEADAKRDDVLKTMLDTPPSPRK